MSHKTCTRCFGGPCDRACPERRCDGGDYCATMDYCLADEANAYSKGLVSIVATNVKTGKSRTVGVAYRRWPKDRGIMLNFCPWCGADIAPKENADA